MKKDGATIQTRFRIKRHPETGPHPVWRVMDGDTLVVTCSYLKGAEALVEYIVGYENRIKDRWTQQAVG